MTEENTLLKTDILAYLKQHENKELMRFITCGSVDDGKSTLIGRLLHDSKMIFEDHLSAIKNDSKRFNTTDQEFDLALLVDGLQSEREQGITIDVAYRYFTTEKRKFIIADTPGHEQYTRNMATGASTCDLAIVMVDARKGVLTQTRRHSFIASLLGIQHVVVAINKMDLVDYSQTRFDEIVAEYKTFAEQLNIPDIRFIPLSALRGDNVVNPSAKLDWFTGKPMLSLLEDINIQRDIQQDEFRFPVQYVIRPNLDFRGFSGTIAAGSIAKGDVIKALPSGKSSRVQAITTFDGELEEAVAGQAVVISLADEIDISRGDMLVKENQQPLLTDALTAHVIWMSEAAMQPNKQYIIKFASKKTVGSIADLQYKIDVNTLSQSDAENLALNEIGLCSVKLTQPVTVDRYCDNRSTGAFIIIDRLSNSTVAVGMVSQADSQVSTGSVDRQLLAKEVVEKLQQAVANIDRLSVADLQELSHQLDRII